MQYLGAADGLRRIRARLAHTTREWRGGRTEDFPACCKARYLADVLLGRSPAQVRGQRRVCACRGYVLCGVFHRRVSDECLACPVRAGLDWQAFPP